VSGNHRHFGGRMGRTRLAALFSCADCLIARVIISMRAIVAFCRQAGRSMTIVVLSDVAKRSRT